MDENTQTDKDLALALATSSRAACTHFTSASMLNPSKEYKFANTGGVNSCSCPMRAPEPNSLHMRCEFTTRQIMCGLYYPDFTVLKKSVSENSNVFYLSRFKTKDSSYSYKIYDKFLNVYNTFDYTDIDLAKNPLDEEVTVFYYALLDQMMINYKDQELENYDQPSAVPVSFIKTLVS
jgi:hypothetical protein